MKVKLTEEQIKGLQEFLMKLENDIRDVFRYVPINADPYTTELYADLQKVIEIIKEAIEKREWDSKNDEFIRETLEEFYQMFREKFFFVIT